MKNKDTEFNTTKYGLMDGITDQAGKYCLDYTPASTIRRALFFWTNLPGSTFDLSCHDIVL